MRFYRPILTLPSQERPQDRLIAKLGGLPWGFPRGDWPTCKGCGEAMAPIAQIDHAPPMIDLGPGGGVLHLFYCPAPACPLYGDASSCASVLIGADGMGSGLTPPPRPQSEERSGTEVWITGWTAHEDGVVREQAPAFLSAATHNALPEAIAQPFDFDNRWDTKAGGVPYWTGNGVTLDPATTPCPPFAFLLQIHQYVYLEQMPAAELSTHQAARIHATTDLDGAPAILADVANFGSDGTGFVFIDRSVEPVQVRWHWSR